MSLAATADDTERARLLGFADRYLDALVARDPARLPLSPDFRYTENTQCLTVGTGLWRTARAREPGGQYFADTETGQVSYWGVIDEMGHRAMIGARLRVEGRLISELEVLVARQSAYFEPDALSAHAPGLHDGIDAADRVPRAELIRIAGLYFDAIEQTDGSRLPVASNCVRLVNGVPDSRADPEQLDAGEAHRSLGIADQMTEGHYTYIEALRERRYPLADVQRGLVQAHVLFDHPGDLARAGGQVPFGYPNSMMYFEVFKVSKGQICQVWALGSTPLPYGISSGWGEAHRN
jgi:hypothetical protein